MANILTLLYRKRLFNNKSRKDLLENAEKQFTFYIAFLRLTLTVRAAEHALCLSS